MKMNTFRRVTSQVALTVVTLGAALVVTAAPAQAQFVQVYASDSNLSNYGAADMKIAVWGQDANFGEVRQAGPIPGNTEWVVWDNPPNGHTIREYREPYRCLDSNRAGALYGMRCNNGDYQRWHFNFLGTKRNFLGHTYSAYQIVNKATGLCLDANRTVGYTLGCNGGDWQTWFLVDINN
ncbi:RICIN domain-containing protein [Micromonospora zamorensis]|uniref:RICIN domain-containing protein n=1 Tax=Micromonospora zamorensis TaxID=709883 RepID=UPI003D8FE704